MLGCLTTGIGAHLGASCKRDSAVAPQISSALASERMLQSVAGLTAGSGQTIGLAALDQCAPLHAYTQLRTVLSCCLLLNLAQVSCGPTGALKSDTLNNGVYPVVLSEALKGEWRRRRDAAVVGLCSDSPCESDHTQADPVDCCEGSTMTVSQRSRWLWVRGYWARRRHLRSMPSKPGVYMDELRPVSGILELKRQQKDSEVTPQLLRTAGKISLDRKYHAPAWPPEHVNLRPGALSRCLRRPESEIFRLPLDRAGRRAAHLWPASQSAQ